jgi:hypothetical protein
MATKSMSYDDPVYRARYTSGGPISGSGIAGTISAHRFVAFTDMLVKAYNFKPKTAGTIANAITALKINANGTGTTTHVLTTYGSAAIASTNILGTFTLAVGDCLDINNAGTDATIQLGCSVEYALVPGAAVTS